MGGGLALALARAFHGSNGWAFPVEFSLAAVFPFGSRNLCGGSFVSKAGVTDPGYSARCYCLDDHRYVNLSYGWVVCFPAYMDLSRARGDLVAVSAFFAWF
jgi:hypothetical protein